MINISLSPPCCAFTHALQILFSPSLCDLKGLHTRLDKETTILLHGTFWSFSNSMPFTVSWKQTYSGILMQQNHSEASSTFKWESFQSGQANPVIIVLSWDVTDSNTSPWCETKLFWHMKDFEPLLPGSVLALALHDYRTTSLSRCTSVLNNFHVCSWQSSSPCNSLAMLLWSVRAPLHKDLIILNHWETEEYL